MNQKIVRTEIFSFWNSCLKRINGLMDSFQQKQKSKVRLKNYTLQVGLSTGWLVLAWQIPLVQLLLIKYRCSLINKVQLFFCSSLETVFVCKHKKCCAPFFLSFCKNCFTKCRVQSIVIFWHRSASWRKRKSYLSLLSYSTVTMPDHAHRFLNFLIMC